MLGTVQYSPWRAVAKENNRVNQKIKANPQIPRKGWECVLFLSFEVSPFLVLVGSWWQWVFPVRCIRTSKNSREWSVSCHLCPVTVEESNAAPPSAGHSLSFWVFSTCTAHMAQLLADLPSSHGSLWAGIPAWAEAGMKSGSVKLDSRNVQLCQLQEGSNCQEKGREHSSGQ